MSQVNKKQLIPIPDPVLGLPSNCTGRLKAGFSIQASHLQLRACSGPLNIDPRRATYSSVGLHLTCTSVLDRLVQRPSDIL